MSIPVFNKIVEWLEHHEKDEEIPKIPRPIPSADLSSFLPEFDAKYINIDDYCLLFDLIRASNMLDIQDLVDLACCRAGANMKDKTPEEIRAMYNIEDDLTEEEKKAMDSDSEESSEEYTGPKFGELPKEPKKEDE